MTIEDLLAAGYQSFQDPTKRASLGDYYRGSFQKSFHDALGERYAITVTHGLFPASVDRPVQPFFSPLVQFHQHDTTFNVEMLRHQETLAQIEAFFAELWQAMRLSYYAGGPEDRRRC
jgi:hypothetical protein